MKLQGQLTNGLVNRIGQGVYVWLPALLLFLFYRYGVKGLSADTGRQIIWILTVMILTTFLYYHNIIWRLIIFYCMFLTIYHKGNVETLVSLMCLWSIGLYASVIYKWKGMTSNKWFYMFIFLWLWSTYAIVARLTGLPSIYILIEDVRHVHYANYAGAFTHTIYQGIFSAMMIPILFAVFPLLIPVAIWTLIGAHCSIAVLGLIIAIMFVLFLRYKWASLISILPLVSIFYFYNVVYDKQPFYTILGAARVKYWNKIFDHIGFTWFGNGLGSFRNILGFYNPIPGDPAHNSMAGVFVNAHNFIIQWYYETGFIGVLLILFYSLYLLYLVLKNRGSLTRIDMCIISSIVISVVSALWQPSLYVVEIGIPTVILLTLLERRLKHA